MEMVKRERRYEKLTPDARDWLISALDPYHDNQLRLEGLPDMVSAPSVVKMHNQSYTLTAPTNAVADWDATVAFTGCNSEIGSLPGIQTAVDNVDNYLQWDHTAPNTGTPFGSFVIKATVAGGSMSWGSPAVLNSTNVAFGACSTDPSSDRCRIIGVAFEITNTTAEIYKQGSLTVGMLPSAVTDYGACTFGDINVSPSLPMPFQTWNSPKFASTRDALIGIPGSCTWPAKDGVYAIPRMITHTMPVETPAHNRRAAVVQSSTFATTYAISCPTSVDLLNHAVFNGVASSGFTAVQAYLTGLSHESTLTITMRTIVEYFPTFGSGLLQLTTPSPPFCPIAFEIYSRTAQIAPYAVPVKQNGAGEYFRKILSIAGAIGSAAAPFLGPVGGVVGLAGQGATALSRYIGTKANERKVAKGKAPPMPPRVRRDEAGARAAPTRR